MSQFDRKRTEMHNVSPQLHIRDELVKKALIAAVEQKMCFPATGKGGRIPVKTEILDRESLGS